jgi:hypothetical protein
MLVAAGSNVQFHGVMVQPSTEERFMMINERLIK